VLTAAARRTRDQPGTSEVVSLAEHTVTVRERPSVDLLVREMRLATLHVELVVEFTERGLAATVRGGRLVELTGGLCTVTATLALEERKVAERKGEIHLPLLVHMGSGLPLLRATDDASTAETAATETEPPAPTPDTGLAIHLPPRRRDVSRLPL
jgi:hypothetical protein